MKYFFAIIKFMNDTELLYLIIFGIIFFIIFSIWVYYYNKKQYEKTSYYEITQVPYWIMLHDLGKNGEYKIYKTLKKYELNGAKFLFNLYYSFSDTFEICFC